MTSEPLTWAEVCERIDIAWMTSRDDATSAMLWDLRLLIVAAAPAMEEQERIVEAVTRYGSALSNGSNRGAHEPQTEELLAAERDVKRLAIARAKGA